MGTDKPVLTEEDYTITKMRAKLEGIKPEKVTHQQTLDNKREDEVEYEQGPEGSPSEPTA